jgi:hypothetical protein
MTQATAAQPRGFGLAPQSPRFSVYPVPRRAAAQLRLALDTLAEAPTEAPEAIPLRAHVERVRVVLQPRLAWPDRPARARLADGNPAPRRSDFYEWILLRRRRAQIAARRAVEWGGLES